MKDLFETISTMCKNHADLITAGVNPEQSLRIAFGDDIATKAIETVKQIEESKEKEATK